MAASHKHHSGLDDNTTNRRIKHATAKSFERTIPEKHVFGTEAEIERFHARLLASVL